MTLESGTRLGSYEILTSIGAGGMGEVYKARDTKLGREVAIKVLPEIFSKDKERLARFEREARLLASLNHPNIATIHDLEESEGTHFLVLEFVPGETLANKISRGPVPVDEALRLFKQIAEALEAAHEKGIIHRDLKPANVKITPENKVKVLDFGLAKAFGDDPAVSDLSQSPTMTRDATRAGVILGTAAYMSPEQSRGKDVDRRTDIWAWGCCLYEALTGRKAFDGETVTDIFAKILEREPEWQLLPGTAPLLLRRLLHRCLEKDPGRRFHDVADVRIEIEECLLGPSSPAAAGMFAPRRRLLPFVVTALAASLVTGILIWSMVKPGAALLKQVKRFSIVLPSADELYTDVLGNSIALSPDGTKIVYLANRGSGSQLFVRSVDRLLPDPIRGTEGARRFFFSPDGQWVAFFAQRQLKKVSLAGGRPPMTLCDVESPTHGGSWSSDDVIYFAGEGLFEVSAAGGTPQPVTQIDAASGETGHRWPEILPDGKAILYTTWFGLRAKVGIALQSLETGEKRILVEGGSGPKYVSSGHIVFNGEDSLLAVPFDLERLEVTGSPVPVLEGVQEGGGGASGYSISQDGTLVYVAEEFASRHGTTVVQVDRQGTAQSLLEIPRIYTEDLRLSPDGRRLAVCRDDDIWTIELARGTWSRLTFQEDWSGRPIWSSDSERILFTSSRRAGTYNIFSMVADGSGAVEQLTTGAYRVPTSLSSDGEILVFQQLNDETGLDIGFLRLDGKSEPQMLLQTPFDEHSGELSRDGRWLVYVSNEAGQEEVYVRPFPEAGGQMRVSTEGGREPVWSRDGREIFYRDDEKMMAVAVSRDPEFRLGKPALLFEGRYRTARSHRQYDVTADGQHFLMTRAHEESAPAQIYVVLNWHQELLEKVPVK